MCAAAVLSVFNGILLTCTVKGSHHNMTRVSISEYALAKEYAFANDSKDLSYIVLVTADNVKNDKLPTRKKKQN